MRSFVENVSRAFGYLSNLRLRRQFVVNEPRSFVFSVLTSGAIALTVTCGTGTPVHAQSQDDYEMDMDMDMEMDMDMDMDMGYDGSDIYGGYSPGRSSSRRGISTQDLLADRITEALTSAFQTTNIASLTDPESAPPVLAGPVLLNDATVAYAKGDHALAMRLYFGHIVAETDSARDQLMLVKYSPLMKRPTWQLRWGISYAVRGDATDPQPIGDTGPVNRGGFGGDSMEMAMDMDMDSEYEQQMGRGRGSRGGRPGRGAGGDDLAMDMEMDMDYEQEMQDEYSMEMDMSMGGYGGGRRKPAEPVGPPTPAARLAALEKTMLSEEADVELTDHLGIVATILGEEFDKRYAQGDFGRAMTDITPESGSVESVSEGFVELMETAAEPLPLWRAGIVFLGEGFSADTARIAQKAELDLLIHIDIYLKPLNGAEFTQNISRCRLIHVPSGKSLGVSKPVDSLDFAKTSRLKSIASRDYVGDQLANFFDIIDRQTVTTELPGLTPEIAKKRIGALLASGGGQNLRTLAEVRLFEMQQLLNENDVLTAFDIVGGEEALALIYGSEEERLRIVRKWAGGNKAEAE